MKDIKIGDRIKALRVEHFLKQKELGKMIGVAESTVSMYELSQRNPDLEILKKLAQIFDVSTDYLLGLSDKKLRSKLPLEAIKQLEQYEQYLIQKYQRQ